ncbi:hypothetical protein MKEN_01286200 [Mycena kentingensis (nom. inval.)]|nr:hypothetical protein MKEN_01286200 [Mycena kentingensis (nom. inval.)]
MATTTTQMPALSLSDSPEFEYLLSEIPFFCVGLAALPIFALFIVTRRISLPTVWLYTSSLMAFGAGILDLSQILIRGATQTNAGLGLDDVTGIVNTREVGFALAFGFRYLYLWAYVAQRPRYEPRPTTQIEPLLTNKLHSASWERFGVSGLVAKFLLLGAVISIPILQILWRILTGNSAVYIAESTMQIAVSVIFMGKLLLNLFLSTVGPWWRPFVPYLVPMLALLISTGIGTGSVLVFKFSETTLGRFLQAVETYLLLTSLLIFAFYNVPKYRSPPTVTARKRSSFFTGYPKAGDVDYQTAVTEKREMPDVVPIGEPIERPFAAAYDRPVSRESRLSRIGSWVLMPRRKAPRPPSVEKRLWDSGAAELGISTETRANSPDADEDVLVLSPRVQVLEEKSPRVRIQDPPSPGTLTAEVQTPKRPPLVVDTTDIEVPAPPATTTTLELATPTERPFTGVSFSSYYGMAGSSRLTMPTISPPETTRNTDSPIYGLDGIIRGPSVPSAPESPILAKPIVVGLPPSPRPVAPAVSSEDSLIVPPTPSPRPPPSPSLAPSIIDQRNSSNSFDELLRQQTELDKSIAALRLFSPSSPVESAPTQLLLQPPMPEVPEAPVTARESKFTDPRSMSMSSNRSEFSLSIFPDPPLVANDLPASLLPMPRARRQSFVPRSAIDSQATADGSITASPAHTRFNSQGTQYDVTSFIGDLTIPGVSKGSGLYDVSERPETSSQSDIESPVITSVQPSLRPFLLTSSTAITSLPSTDTSPPGAVSPSNTTSPTYEYPVLKPLLLGGNTNTNNAPTVPSPLRRTPGQSLSSMNTVTTSTRKPSRRGGERPLISVPRQLEDELDGSAAAGAFEKPRRPPVVR